MVSLIVIDIIKKNLRNLNSTSLGKKVCDNLMKKYREFLIGGGFSSNTNITTNSYNTGGKYRKGKGNKKVHQRMRSKARNHHMECN